MGLLGSRFHQQPAPPIGCEAKRTTGYTSRLERDYAAYKFVQIMD